MRIIKLLVFLSLALILISLFLPFYGVPILGYLIWGFYTLIYSLLINPRIIQNDPFAQIAILCLLTIILSIVSLFKRRVSILAGLSALGFFAILSRIPPRSNGISTSGYGFTLIALAGTLLIIAFIKEVSISTILRFFTLKRLLPLGILLTIFSLVFFVPPYMKGLAYSASDSIALEIDPEITDAHTKFALSLAKELTEENEGKNIFISPLSISLALTMTYNGAGGSTEEAMRRTLGYENMTVDRINEGNLKTLESLEEIDETIQLNICNSIWLRDSFSAEVRQDFKDRLTHYYMSDLFTGSFDQGTVSEVNNWVSEKTNQKIPKVLDSINSEDAMFLVNAIYFKGDWTKVFSEEKTYSGDFHLSDGTTVKTDFMHQSDEKHGYGWFEDMQVLRLSYGRGKAAMYVFLPRSGTSVDSLLGDLTQEKLDGYISKIFKGEVIVKLPKFKIEYGARLDNALTRLGMGVAFDPSQANFTGIATSPLWIDFVDHKAFVEVNEKGTEAAAATMISMNESGPPSFTADRPFLFFIRDDRTGTILFMGKVEDPT